MADAVATATGSPVGATIVTTLPTSPNRSDRRRKSVTWPRATTVPTIWDFAAPGVPWTLPHKSSRRSRVDIRVRSCLYAAGDDAAILHLRWWSAAADRVHAQPGHLGRGPSPSGMATPDLPTVGPLQAGQADESRPASTSTSSVFRWVPGLGRDQARHLAGTGDVVAQPD